MTRCRRRRVQRVAAATAIAMAVAAVMAQAAFADLVTFGGATTETSHESTVTVATPSGASTANNGSLLLAQVSTAGSSIATPSGWNVVAATTNNDVRQTVFSRRYTVAAPSYTFTAATSNRPLVVTLAVYNGVDDTYPLQVGSGGSANTGAGTTATSNVDDGQTGLPGSAATGSRAVGFGTIDGSPNIPALALTGPSGAVSRGSGSDQGNANTKVIAGMADVAATIPNTSAFTWSSSDSRDWIAFEGIVRAGTAGAIATAPGAPQSVSGTAGDGKVTVSWTAPSDDGGAAITGYSVSASPGGATCTTTGALTCDVTGLTNGTAYTFSVTATNDVDNGAAATSAPVTPQAPSPSPSPSPSLPGAPRSVQGQAGDGSAVITWRKPKGTDTGITGYTATASPGGASCTSTAFECTITGLTNGTAYTATVVARNAAGDGPASIASAAFTPAAAASPTTGRKNATDNRPRPKVTLCHATSSATNPYVVITVDPNSVITRGHDQHQDGRDIIPAFTYEENGQTISYPGKNLDARGIALLGSGCTALVDRSSAAALSQAATPAPVKTRVTLCHATASATNPYVRITVAPEAVLTQGHDQHQDGRDIIPPFSYEQRGSTVSYPGKNWDSDSQAIFDNGCRPVGPETGPASLSAEVSFCAAVGGGQYVRTTLTVAQVLARDPNAGDIIAPFSYTEKGAKKQFAGSNWSNATRRILNAGCVAPVVPVATQPVAPATTCIDVNDDGSFTAYFGYANPNPVAVTAPVGAANAVTLNAGAAGAAVGTQPATFLPGSMDVALTVTGIGSEGSVTWTVAAPGEARSATATAASSRCPAPAVTPEISVRAECVVDMGNGTYSALFGYQSDETTTITVPIGAQNTLTQSSGGAIDQVQTSAFSPGLHAGAFSVSGISASRSVTWRVMTGATPRTATASLASLPSCYPPPEPPSGGRTSGPGTTGGLTPYQVPNPGPGGNVTCEQIGYAKSSGRINYSDAGFTQAFAKQGITVGVSGGTYVTWSAGFPIGAVIVKGGPRANVYEYVPGRYGDRDLASPVNSSGKPAGLSNLTICWNPGAPGPDPNPPTPTPQTTPTGTPVVPEPIGVTVACVKKNTDGTYDAVFGYTNPNALSVTVDAGAANYVSQAPGDPGSQLRGQPTSFMPGTSSAAFVVPGIPSSTSVTWTVAYYGTRQATADVLFPTACTPTSLIDPTEVKKAPAPTPSAPIDPKTQILVAPTPTPPAPSTANLGVFVTCATVGGRTYSATFGFTNPAGASLSIPVGPDNRIVGARSYNQGQPGEFTAGTDPAAFTVTGIPRGTSPEWQVTLPSGRVVTALATDSAPRCAATSRPAAPQVTTTITTPRRVRTRSKVTTRVTVSNPGTAPLYKVIVTIPTPRNTSRFTKVIPPAGATCTRTATRAVCTFASLLPGAAPQIRLTSIAGTPGTRFPLSRAAGTSDAGDALVAVDSTPLTVYAVGPQPVTG